MSKVFNRPSRKVTTSQEVVSAYDTEVSLATLSEIESEVDFPRRFTPKLIKTAISGGGIDVEAAYNAAVAEGLDSEIISGLETAIRRYSPSTLNAAILGLAPDVEAEYNSAVPSALASDIITGTETAIRRYSPSTLNAAILGLAPDVEAEYNSAVPEGLYSDIISGAITTTRRYSPYTLKQAILSFTASALTYQAGYNATTNTPDLTTSPNSILKGFVYTVKTGGTFFGEEVSIGDMLIAEQDNPSALSHWTRVESNLYDTAVKTLYESNPDTNCLTDALLAIINKWGDFNTTNTTYNITAGMTAAQAQAVIDSVPKYIPAGVSSTIQLANGTYTFSSKIHITGFYGGGLLNLYGNTGDGSSAYTAQSVVIDSSASNVDTIEIQRNSVHIQVSNIKTITKDGYNGIYVNSNHAVVDVRYGYTTHNAKTSSSSSGIYSSLSSLVRVLSTYFSNNYRAVHSGNGSYISVNSCPSTGTNPDYGLYSNGGIIVKSNTQPTGAVADEDDGGYGLILGKYPYVNKTYTITAGSTAAQIQAVIDNIPRYIPYGRTVTIQFENGTYTTTARIDVTGFEGPGTLLVYGDTTEVNASASHTTQNVHINSSASNVDTLRFYRNSCYIQVFNLRVTCKDGYIAVRDQDNAQMVDFRFGYIAHSAKTSTSSIGFYKVNSAGAGRVTTTLFSNNYYAMQAEGCTLCSNGNGSTGTNPNYGLRTLIGQIIKNGTQPTGATANELVSSGQII